MAFGGCGSAIFATAFPELGIGFAGVTLTLGLTVLTGAYAFISGGHFNLAVSMGLWGGQRFAGKDLLPDLATQVNSLATDGIFLHRDYGGYG